MNAVNSVDTRVREEAEILKKLRTRIMPELRSIEGVRLGTYQNFINEIVQD